MTVAVTRPAHARSLFITGTDTGVGKTTVGCALAAAFRLAGHRVATLKPIETGCAPSPNGLVAEDAMRLARAAGSTAPPNLLCPNRFVLPTSPEVAAAAEGRLVDTDAILAARDTLAADADVLLIEGAGGLLVPLAPGRLMVDLVADLAAPLLIVARASLGTVNHSLLTLEAAHRRGLSVLGVILNRSAVTEGPDEATNAAAIATHGRTTVYGTLPHAPNASDQDLAVSAGRHLDLEALWLALQAVSPPPRT